MREPYVDDGDMVLWNGHVTDVLHELLPGSVDAVVTSPPYLDQRSEYPDVPAGDWPEIFRELARVVDGGMLWNVGRVWRDGVEQLWWTDLIRDAKISGWEHWDTIVWIRPNSNPLHGRVLANSHEYVLVFARPGVRFNVDAVRTEYAPGSADRLRRKWLRGSTVKGHDLEEAVARDVNELGARGRSYHVCYTGREKGNPHPAPMPLELAEYLVRLASWEGQKILDPFAGSGTTGLAARGLDRHSTLIELSLPYCDIIAERMQQLSLPHA